MTAATRKRIPKRPTAASVRRELITLKRRMKRAIVDSGRRGWITPEHARHLINTLGLRHE